MAPTDQRSRILVVDDDEGLLLLMAGVLREDGYAVETADSGRAAFQWLGTHTPPDLMLLDLKMRDLDGPSLLGKLQSGTTRVPFVVVTGQGNEKAAVEVMKRGALDYVMKDTGLLDLLPTIVKRVLGGLAQEKALVAAQAEHRRLEGEILAASERERHSIGADLHDGLGQLLTAVELSCSMMKADTVKSHPALARRLDQMGGMLREAVAQTRYLARGLVPVGGDPDALQIGLAELASRTNGLGKITCEFDCPEPVLLNDPAVAGHLYRIAQEAVNNALKHACARQVNIQLGKDEGHLRLEICDNGVGLPKDLTAAGVGLGVMRHRASVIGAELTVRTLSPGGVTITCLLPLKS